MITRNKRWQETLCKGIEMCKINNFLVAFCHPLTPNKWTLSMPNCVNKNQFANTVIRISNISMLLTMKPAYHSSHCNYCPTHPHLLKTHNTDQDGSERLQSLQNHNNKTISKKWTRCAGARKQVASPHLCVAGLKLFFKLRDFVL